MVPACEESEGQLWVPHLCATCNSSHEGPCILEALQTGLAVAPPETTANPYFTSLTGIFSQISTTGAFSSKIQSIYRNIRSRKREIEDLWEEACTTTKEFLDKTHGGFHRLENDHYDVKNLKKLRVAMESDFKKENPLPENPANLMEDYQLELFKSVEQQARFRVCTACRTECTDPFCSSCIPKLNDLVTAKRIKVSK